MTYLYDSTIHLICPFADKKKARQLLADIDKTHVYEKRAENKEALRQLLQDFGEVYE